LPKSGGIFGLVCCHLMFCALLEGVLLGYP
jgi:hypothetical protein